MVELQILDPSLSASTKHDIRTKYGGMGIHIFGDQIRNAYHLQSPSAFVNRIAHATEDIPFDDEDGDGLTWLHYAASNGASVAVQLLIQQPNCDIDCCTTHDWTPLYMACAAGHSEVAELLLDNHANAQAKSSIGKTCLHYLQAFDPNVVQRVANRLLGSRADIEAKDFNDETPLFSACLSRDGHDAIAAIDVLIKHGANPTSVSGSGYSCIDLAAMNLRPNLLSALLKSRFFADARAPDSSVSVRAKALKNLIKEPRYHRFRNGGASYQSQTEEVLKILISEDVVSAYMAESPKGYNPLQDACIWGCSDLIDPLLSFSAIEINRFAHRGDTVNSLPLFEALKLDNAEIVRALLDHGADVTLSDSAGRNVLHFAVEFAPDLLRHFLTLLTEARYDIQKFIDAGTQRRGFTPLDVAVHAERFDQADVLLRLGAQYHQLTRLGEVGERYTSLGSTGGSRRQMSYFLDLPPGRRPGLTVCNHGFTLFHITAASFDNGESASESDKIAIMADPSNSQSF